MKIVYKLAIAVIIYALMAIPDSKEPFPIKESEGYSVTSDWWGTYAQTLVKYRIINPAARVYYYNLHRRNLIKYLDQMELELTESDSPLLDSINYSVIKLSALASLVPNKINEFETDISRWRKLLKYQSRFWNTSSTSEGSRLYRLLVESRLAFESALVQTDFPSIALSAEPMDNGFQYKKIKNIIFQSGDIVAFNLAKEGEHSISFRRDMPNAYDHLGTVYIQNQEVSITFIDKETGLSNIPVETFLDNYAPNGMVLRIRPDISAIIQNPQLPIAAAKALFDMANSGTYKYDYKLDLDSKNYLFDWEMLSKAFKSYGFTIGTEKRLSNTQTIRVGSNEIIKEPFELEYDPQLIVVGEWYKTKTLYDKRLLTAATSSIILSANKLAFVNPLFLPIYRLKKGYSMMMHQVGLKEPIPQGITAQTQMAMDALHKEQKRTVDKLSKELVNYENQQNHKATYLKMLQAAKELKSDKVADL